MSVLIRTLLEETNLSTALVQLIGDYSGDAWDHLQSVCTQVRMFQSTDLRYISGDVADYIYYQYSRRGVILVRHRVKFINTSDSLRCTECSQPTSYMDFMGKGLSIRHISDYGCIYCHDRKQRMKNRLRFILFPVIIPLVGFYIRKRIQ